MYVDFKLQIYRNHNDFKMGLHSIAAGIQNLSLCIRNEKRLLKT
jgi:hypothetical protein